MLPLALALASLSAGTGLVVVAPAGWEGALRAFVEARAKERPTSFLALEDALARNSGVDAPERLKRELHRRWKDEGLGFVLLVGDADTMPVRFMVLDRCTEPAFHYAFYASDHYYADVAHPDGSFDDWNAAREGFHADYFGEVRGECSKDAAINFDRVSYVPELALGRWPVSSAAEAQALAAKTLAWKPSDKGPRALVAHAPEWIDARAQVGALAQAWQARGFEVTRQFYGESDDVPSPQSVERALHAGVDLAVHIGHGTEESWHRCLLPEQRDALATARPAVYVSVGCSTAHLVNEPPYQPYLDRFGIAHRGTNAGEIFREPPPAPHCYQPGPLNSSGLGERLMRLPSGGAVAYIGCGTGAQPCALSLLEGFSNALAAEPTACVGEAWRQALAHYFVRERLAELTPDEGWYPPSVYFQGMKFLYFGDPTLRLR